jgi:hypothetical protein
MFMAECRMDSGYFQIFGLSVVFNYMHYFFSLLLQQTIKGSQFIKIALPYFPQIAFIPSTY